MNELMLRQIKVISNSKVMLKPVGFRCVGLIWELAQDIEVTRYLRWEPPRSINETKAFVLDSKLNFAAGLEHKFAIELLDQQKLVGVVKLFSVDRMTGSFAIGTWLLPRAWGQAVNRLAKGIVLETMFMVLGFDRVWCRVQRENTRSRRALEKLLFRQTGYQKNGRYKDGVYHDEVYYELTKEEYLKSGRWGYDPSLRIMTNDGDVFTLEGSAFDCEHGTNDPLKEKSLPSHFARTCSLKNVLGDFDTSSGPAAPVPELPITDQPYDLKLAEWPVQER